MLWCLPSIFRTLLTRYPNAFVRIDEMKCDGNAIQFNANNFFYGDIEGKGTYRVELFNIYGIGAADGKVLNSAFSNSQNMGSESAPHFNNSLAITYTVFIDGNVQARIHLIWLLFLIGMVQVHGGIMPEVH